MSEQRSIWRGVKAWPALWASEPILLAEARKQSYLVHVAANGDLACKACEKYLPWEDPNVHFQRHMAELDRFLLSKQEAKRDEEVEGFYPKPCESCGNDIPRTGKAGRPPRLCDACKYPMAALSDEELLTEMGL